MADDHYAGSAEAWARGATLVYAPIARELLATSPHPFAGRTVLDVGAGTGVSSDVLTAAGASVVASDLSSDMLHWEQASRPAAVVADVTRLPLRNGAVDDAVASFVLHHLLDPAIGIRELARVVRPGGSLVATVFANASQSEARDRIDAVAGDHGWSSPSWYIELKTSAAPVLGTAEAMAQLVGNSGWAVLSVDERPVDVGVTQAADLVDYRFGQAHLSGWLAGLTDDRREALRRAAVMAVEPIMEPYRPIVVFLCAART